LQKTFWQKKLFIYLCSPENEAVLKPFQNQKKRPGNQALGYALKNILNNETDISTLSKEKKKQARFQKPYGNQEWSQGAGCPQGKRPQKAHRV
jgi:hypothetical protein